MAEGANWSNLSASCVCVRSVAHHKVGHIERSDLCKES